MNVMKLPGWPFWRYIILTCMAVLYGGFSSASTEPQGIDSKAAYKLVTENPSNAYILDVRTRAEYEFVGHPDLPNGVPNIPFKFYPEWEINKNFVQDVARRFSKDKTIITLCRSGKRAKVAAGRLHEAGYQNIYYMTDSFEGPKDSQGHRTVGGWKVNGLPYTYKLDERLVYQ